MQVLVRRKEFLEASGQNQREAVDALRFRGSKLEDLCLDFTLPGYPEYELKSKGQDIAVYAMIVLRVGRFALMFVCLVATEVDRVWSDKFFLFFVFSVQVNLDNLEEYVSLVVEATVKSGIGAQIEAFRAGFNQVEF